MINGLVAHVELEHEITFLKCNSYLVKYNSLLLCGVIMPSTCEMD